jgi:uncharacterized protein (DUF302 family)
MKNWFAISLLMVSLVVAPAQAEELMMARVHKPYAEAMLALQDMITLSGYQVMRVQRVDVGLKSRGFPTAEYRVVFFGKSAEVQTISKQYPELMPYLPLKITLFAEGETSLLVTNNPHMLREFFKAPELQAVFTRWETDVREILDALAESK